MELNSLRVFQAVAQAGSITRAAERLNTVQPNVTSRIRQLEDELGAALFHRKPRGVCLTPAGKTLLDYADRLFQLVAEASGAMREETAPEGALTIGCTMAFAAFRLPAILGRFLEAAPKARALPVTDTSRRLVERVLAFELDGAFVNGLLDNDQLEQLTVYQDELCLVSAKGAPPPREMARRVALVFPQGCAYRINLEYWLHTSGLIPYELTEVGSLEGILGCVASGVGFTVLTRNIVETSRHAARLSLRPLPEPQATLPVVFVRRRQRVDSRAMEEFTRAALETARLDAGGAKAGAPLPDAAPCPAV